MKKSIFYFFIFLSLLALGLRYGLTPVSEMLGYQARSGLKITAVPEARVILNGKAFGKTPFQDENLPIGEYLVKLQTDQASWQGQIKLSAGTMAVINWEITANSVSSSGEILTLDFGQGAVITSVPDSASVEVDGSFKGKTPLNLADLSPGEHTFLISREGYLTRSIRALSPDKMTLFVNVNLAISEADLPTLVLPKVVASTKYIVKKTPLGFLRVRDKPSLKGKEVGRVTTGEQVTMVEELSGWMRVKTASGLEGYVSVAYIQKQS